MSDPVTPEQLSNVELNRLISEPVTIELHDGRRVFMKRWAPVVEIGQAVSVTIQGLLVPAEDNDE